MLANFQRFFTARHGNKFVIEWSLETPPHLKHVAALPCEMTNMFSLNVAFFSAQPCIYGIISVKQSRKPWPANDSAAHVFTVAMICGL